MTRAAARESIALDIGSRMMCGAFVLHRLFPKREPRFGTTLSLPTGCATSLHNRRERPARGARQSWIKSVEVSLF